MRKGQFLSEEHKSKISKANSGENNPMYGKKGKDSPRFRKKHSEETKKKMSKTQKRRFENIENHPSYGMKHTEETKLKMSEARKGFKHTKETKKKISEARKGENNHMYGKKHTEESKRKITKNHADFSGEKHPNWKGGISCEPYCDVWLDKEYKKSIKERDNYTCQNPFCLCDNSNLVIHHINYIKKDCKPDNLITVCNSSNIRANKDRWFWQEIYEN